MFQDRFDAGRQLAQKLLRYRNQSDLLVLALPRGGVPVAFEVARALDAPLDVFVVRKLGYPPAPELAMGAVASGGVIVLNDSVVEQTGVPQTVIQRVAERERRELHRQEAEYRGSRPRPQILGRTVILVDDGLATGSTMLAAVRAIKKLRPARLVVAVPVGARQTCAEFQHEVDEIVCAVCPQDFQAVSLWYEDFAPTQDQIVVKLLEDAESAQIG
jgi:predicted phosphoribosyltransferase